MIKSVPDPRAVWQWRAKRTVRLTALLVGSLAVVLGLAVNESAQVERDERRFPPPGRIVSTGEVRLHIYCTGPKGSAPTIVLEAGKGGFSLAWAPIQQALAANYRVCSYDRAGYGWSGVDAAARDAQRVANQLHAALAAAREGRPFVLVAHSMGALFARMYVDKYPGDVVGLVFLDPTHEDQVTRLPKSYLKERRDRGLGAGLKILSADLGIERAKHKPAHATFLPAWARAPFVAKTVTGRWLRAQWAEEDAWDLTDQEVRATGALGDLPLLILTAGTGETREFLSAKQQLQLEMSRLSTRGEQRIVPGADHYAFFFNTKYQQVATRAVQEMMSNMSNSSAPRSLNTR